MARFDSVPVKPSANDAEVGALIYDKLRLGYSVEVIKKSVQGGYRIAELRVWNGERGDGSNGDKAKENTDYKPQAAPPGSLAP